MSRDWQERIARLRVPFGYVIGVVYLVFSRPTFASVAIGFVPALLGMLIRGWASGHLQKGETLATSGPYACTRNPLYFGSFFLVVALGIMGRTWWLALVLLAAFLFFYLSAMTAEAKWLEKTFGASYRDYAARVPLFLPRLASLGSGEVGFRWDLYRRNREARALVGFLLALLMMLAKAYLLPM